MFPANSYAFKQKPLESRATDQNFSLCRDVGMIQMQSQITICQEDSLAFLAHLCVGPNTLWLTDENLLECIHWAYYQLHQPQS